MFLILLRQRPGQGLLKQACAVGGQNRFRVELEAAHAAMIVAHRHHHLAEPGVDGEIGRDIAADQRVVARYRQRVGHAGEHTFAIVNDRRGLAVQDLARLADLAAVGFDDRLLRRVRDFAEVRANGVISGSVAAQALDMLNVDAEGFDYMDRKLLLAIIDKFTGGPVGLDNLAAAIGEERETIEDVIEPFLIQQGFIQRTPRGRLATQHAYRHFGLEREA